MNERKTDLKKITFIGITLTLPLGLGLRRQQQTAAAKAASMSAPIVINDFKADNDLATTPLC